MKFFYFMLHILIISCHAGFSFIFFSYSNFKVKPTVSRTLILGDSNLERVRGRVRHHLYPFPGLAISDLLVNVEEKVNKYLRNENLTMCYIILGTNDFSPQRQMFSFQYLLLCLFRSIHALETECSVALIVPPPKSDPNLSQLISDFFDYVEHVLYMQMPHVRMHRPFWVKEHVGPDGIHLSKQGQDFLSQFLNSLRRPASQPQFGKPSRPPRRFLTVSDDPQVMDTPYLTPGPKVKPEEIIPREKRLYSYIRRVLDAADIAGQNKVAVRSLKNSTQAQQVTDKTSEVKSPPLQAMQISEQVNNKVSEVNRRTKSVTRKSLEVTLDNPQVTSESPEVTTSNSKVKVPVTETKNFLSNDFKITSTLNSPHEAVAKKQNKHALMPSRKRKNRLSKNQAKQQVKKSKGAQGKAPSTQTGTLSACGKYFIFE